MSAAWATIAIVAIATAAIRACGPVLLGGRALPRRLTLVISLLAPALLAALVVTQTFGAPTGGALEVDARAIGVAIAGVILLRGGSTLPAVLAAAAATALARTIAG